MSADQFDAIVVGAGCAGAVAAYRLASAGRSVLVVERGNFAGAKNMTGGRIYTHALARVFPDFEGSAPLQRRITHEKISMAAPDALFTMDFTADELRESGKDSYAVLRGPFDQWLAERAEEAGADFIYGIAVEDLIVRDGRVCGVVAGGDEGEARITVLADGANSLLAQKAGLADDVPLPCQMAVGAKETIALPPSVIEDRFLCAPGECAAWMFAGDCTKGRVGGGFLYTNDDSISLGLVATISLAADGANETPVYQMLEDFKGHPAVAPIIRGAKLVEHSGHMVPEGGYGMIPKYVFDGCLVAGESAGLCMNMGYQVRGMDFAVASGQMAGQAAVRALDAGDTSEAGLASYKEAMEGSFVIQDLRTFSKWPHVMEGWDRMFTEYPAMARDVFNAMFSVDGKQQKPLIKRILPIVKQRGTLKLAGEVRKAGEER
mgnify:CR=1 FL=1